MEIDIYCIKNELNKIRDSYIDSYIILHALAALELIDIIKETNIITWDLIKILRYLQKDINCYIDFDLFNYLYTKKKIVILKDNNEELDIIEEENLLSQNLQHRINKMLFEDRILLNQLLETHQISLDKDCYGKLDKNVLDASKRLFDIVDVDKDGYISAMDVVIVIEKYKEHPLIFENDLCNVMVELIVSKRIPRIDFQIFHNYINT